MKKKQTTRLVIGLSLISTLILVLVTAAQESVQVPTDPNVAMTEQQRKEWKNEQKEAFARLKPEELMGERQLTEEQKKKFVFLTTEEVDEILLTQLRDKSLQQSDPEKLVAVVKRTGERKIVTAIPELIDLLTLRREFDWERRSKERLPEELQIISVYQNITASVRYPAIGALGQIGKPALPALLEVIKNQDNESLESQNALEAVQVVFYPDLQQTVDYLRQQANEAVAPANSRLYAAAEKITKKIKR